jgi:putative tryptophan/tyrosine transport system substrate-binding protein
LCTRCQSRLPKPKDSSRLPSRTGLPAATPHLPYVRSGLLLSYVTDVGKQLRRAGVYVDRILKGVKPADLPVEQPEKFDLTINLRTAKALGLQMPQSALTRADEVIPRADEVIQ